jgi:hypothetical protein
MSYSRKKIDGTDWEAYYKYCLRSKKYITALKFKHKIPRKWKKVILGDKVSKSKLRRLLKSVQIVINNKPSESNEVLPFYFCPVCGSTKSYIVDHHVEYPEVWYEEFCLRCGLNIGGADNSVYMHILEDINESKDYNPEYI